MEYRKTIVLDRDELLQDIRNSGFIQGDSLGTVRDKARLKDIAEYNNVEEVTRYMDLAEGEADNALYPFSRVEKCGRESLVTDQYKESDYVMYLTFRKQFPENATKYVCTLVHEYIRARVMYLFTSEAFPDLTAVWKPWLDKSEDLMAKIKDAKRKAQGTMKRALYPFY